MRWNRILLAGLLIAVAVGLLGFGYLRWRDYAREGQFKPGLHDVRTGRAVEKMDDLLSDEAQLVFIIHFDTRCSHCQEYAGKVLEAKALIEAKHEPGLVIFVLMNVGQESDRTIKSFIRQHGIPDDVSVIAGAPENYNRGVPETFLFYRLLDSWYSAGSSRKGTQEPEFLAEVADKVIAVAGTLE